MRCRRLKNENGTKNVVWFGSYGKNLDGTAKFFNASNKHDNFSDYQQGVADSLTQHLSIIQNELWYATNYGLSLLDKHKDKLFFDAEAYQIIMDHPDVKAILEYDSEKIGTRYFATTRILTIFGEATFQI